MNGYTPGISIGLLVCFLLQAGEARSQIDASKPREHAVGFKLLEAQDQSRVVTGGASPGGTHSRPIRTYLWYPARASGKPGPMNFGRYFELADEDIWPAPITGDLHRKLKFSRRALARSLGSQRLEELKRKPAAAVEDAQAQAGPFPLIAIGQGLYYESPVVFAALAEHLAGNGFVVATCPLVGTNSPIVTMDVLGLETQVRDLEYSIAQARAQAFVSETKLGVFGFDMGGMAGLILSMRNADVDAFVSVSSGILYPQPSDIPMAAPDYDPTALRAPWLHSVPRSWLRQPGVSDENTLFDLARHSERYLLLTEGMGHVDYTSYALIENRPAMLEYWEAAKPGDAARYEEVVRYVTSFFAAYLKHDPDALGFLSKEPAEVMPGAALSLEHRPAAPAAITYEEFVQAVVAGNAEAAIDELREFQATHPEHILFDEKHLNRLVYSLRGTWRLDKEVLPVLKFTAELYPTSVEVLYMLAEGHIVLGEYQAAIRNYERLLVLDPEDKHNYIKPRLEWLHNQ